LKAQEQFDKPGSVARNPNMAAILHETQFAETKGSGMRVMRQELQQAGLSVPTFESDRENDVFRVTFLFHHLLDKAAWEWLGRFKEHNLSDELLRALVFVKETTQISNLAFRDITGLDTLAASTGLRKLSKIGLLEKQGVGANTFYVASHTMLEAIESASGDVSPAALQGSLQGSLQDSGLSKNERIASIDAKLPLPLRRRLVHLRMGKRAEPEELRELVVDVCRHMPLSKEQIALVVNRNPAFVAQNYLTPLVKEGRLQLTIPQAPSHPDQKYQSNERKK
jgi:ATP-dependent DNA helicase RecG